MADRLTPPILSYRDLRRRAGDFLRTHHPAGTIPVPIEEIVEFRYRKRFQRDLDEADRGWLEYQAYAFAGLILVPKGRSVALVGNWKWPFGSSQSYDVSRRRSTGLDGSPSWD